MKTFEQVQVGDEGQDYGGETAGVIAKGKLAELKHFDSTGACDYMDEGDELLDFVAVRYPNERGSILWVYGDGGFIVS